MNTNEQFERVPSDAELRHEGLLLGWQRISRATKAANHALPWHERLLGKVSGNFLSNFLFPNRSQQWRDDMPVNDEAVETVQGMFEGDQLGGLHKTDVLKIVNRTDRIAETIRQDELAALDAEYTSALGDVAAAPTEASDSDARAEQARRDIEALSDDNFNLAA